MARTPKPTTADVQGAKASPTAEIGVSGLRAFHGYLDEEFVPALRGASGRRKLREMADNDPTVGAVLSAIGLVVRAVDWTWEPSPDAASQATAEAEAEFAESLFADMSHTQEEFLGEMIWGTLTYGFSPHEIVLKRRLGPDQKDPAKRSRYTDGRIGIRKLPLRAQDTIDRWDMQEDGGIAGVWQQPPMGGGLRYLPIERLLIFRTVSRKNSPEGVSILRNAYKPWFFLNKIQEIEAVGIERELAGLPVIRLPSSLLSATDAESRAILEVYKKLGRDAKNNSQGCAILPSDTYKGPTGEISSVRMIDFEVLKGGGTRAIDTSAVVRRYQQDIARSVLADFIMLGADGKGSYALSDNKTSLFYRAIETILWDAAAVINRHLMPRLWAINGLPFETMPSIVPGRLAGVDLDKLGEFVGKIAAAGAPLFPDDELEDRLREEADLPPKSEEARELQAGLLAAPARMDGPGQPQIDKPGKPAADKPAGKPRTPAQGQSSKDRLEE
jgi:hypothetical protein